MTISTAFSSSARRKGRTAIARVSEYWYVWGGRVSDFNLLIFHSAINQFYWDCVKSDKSQSGWKTGDLSPKKKIRQKFVAAGAIAPLQTDARSERARERESQPAGP